MILFLPINIYRARYQVADGRPYSAFERLLLEAIGGEGISTTEALADELCVHERLVIEGVATLLEAGWVALGDESRLVVTTAGKRCCRSSWLMGSRSHWLMAIARVSAS